MAKSAKNVARSAPVRFAYHTLRSVTAPGLDTNEKGDERKRYCGVAPANSLFEISTSENVRGYLGRDEEGERRKSTQVNMAIRKTLEEDREWFSLLNTGVVIVARDVKVDDAGKIASLYDCSIINGAQTRGVLQDYFNERPEDRDFPSVNFELLVTDDEDLIGEISISRNYQNAVAALSIYGRQGLLDSLEKAMQEEDPEIRLRKSETHFGDGYLDSEKLIQVLTAMAPSEEIPLPSAVRRKQKTPETMYRVYAYRHRSRCLKDFATVLSDPKTWGEGEDWSIAREYFLQTAVSAWRLYTRLKGEQAFSRLHCVEGRTVNGSKKVNPDGVPDGIVFPMLSALSRFMHRGRNGWRLNIPPQFPWNALFSQAVIQHTATAGHNPQAMGKDARCYIALHGTLDMYFAMTGKAS